LKIATAGCTSGDPVTQDPARYISQTKITALKAIGQSQVIDTKLMQ
jgi:hypothetical protein